MGDSLFNELEQLRGKALTARQRLAERYKYDLIHDYRTTIFEQIDRIIIYHDTNIILFLQNLINPQYISDLFHTTETDSKRIAIDYLKCTRYSLIIFMQSIIESYYRTLSTVLGLKAAYSFIKVVDSIFKCFQIRKDSDWYKANAILAKIRNTLHNNGIHTHNNEMISYHGKQYAFIKDSLHNAADYDTIIHIISDIIDLLYCLGDKSSSVELIDNNRCVDYFDLP